MFMSVLPQMPISTARKGPGRACSICSHTGLLAIEERRLKGVSLRRIAREFGASASSVRRHVAICLPRRNLQVKEACPSKGLTALGSSGRRCSVCSRPDVGLINKLAVDGCSIRDIAGQIGSGSSRTSVHRHIRRCLGLEIRMLIKKNRIATVLDVHRAFDELLEETDRAYCAARAILEVDGEIDFHPRAWEVIVVYDDYCDLRKNGVPRQKRELLSSLLERLAEINVEPKTSFINMSDPRLLLRLATDQQLRVLDRISRFYAFSGETSKFEEELGSIRETIRRTADKMGTDYNSELKIFLEDSSERLRPDLWQTLYNESREIYG
jgi:hypothetical protein